LAQIDFAGAYVLLVDDDNGVREVTATILREFGYKVLEAGSGGAALDLLQREPNIDLMLIDFAMPGMSGADVARRIRRLRPELPMLFITGFADRTGLAGVAEQHIIGKPYRREQLAQKIRDALAEAGTGNVVRLRG
jgi:CheY-like chemotaxis protein